MYRNTCTYEYQWRWDYLNASFAVNCRSEAMFALITKQFGSFNSLLGGDAAKSRLSSTYLRLSYILLGLFLVCLITLAPPGAIDDEKRLYPVRAPGEVIILIRSYQKAERRQLESLLYSLRAQSYENFKVWLFDSDNLNGQVLADVIQDLNDNRFSVFVPANPIAKFENSYGYGAAEIVLNRLLPALFEYYSKSSPSEDGYILLTNGDNLYNYKFLEKLVAHFAKAGPETCVVSTSFVSRYPDTDTGIENLVLEAKPELHAVDLGAALTSVKALLKAFPNKVHFVKNEVTADYLFFDTIRTASGLSCWSTMREVLYYHQ